MKPGSDCRNTSAAPGLPLGLLFSHINGNGHAWEFSDLLPLRGWDDFPQANNIILPAHGYRSFWWLCCHTRLHNTTELLATVTSSQVLTAGRRSQLEGTQAEPDGFSCPENQCFLFCRTWEAVLHELVSMWYSGCQCGIQRTNLEYFLPFRLRETEKLRKTIHWIRTFCHGKG